MTTQGLNYIIGDNISIQNLGVHIYGWSYLIGTPDDDTFLINDTFGLQEASIANTFTIDGGGGEDNFDVISGEILLENDNVTVIDGGSVSINFPIETTPETILGNTEIITIVDNSDITFTANEPESDVLEESEKTGGGSFNYLTLFYLAFFSFLQQQRNRKIKS